MKRSELTIPSLRRFFTENPGEILSYDDIATKFGCSRQKAKNACMHLKKEGLLQTMVVAMVNLDNPARIAAATPSDVDHDEGEGETSALAETSVQTADLTDREREVLAKIVAGHDSYKALAKALGISHGTVNDHTRALYRKLGVRSMVSAAVWAVRNGIA